MIPFEHEANATDMQMCHNSGELRYLSRSDTSLPTVCGGSTTLSRKLLLVALFEPWNDLDMLKNPEQLVREVALKPRLHSCSHPNVYVGRHNVEIFINPPFSHGYSYVTVFSWGSDFDVSRLFAVPAATIFTFDFYVMLGAAHVGPATGT